MWSLPDINRLNARAAQAASALVKTAARKHKPKCDIHRCRNRATDSTLWYDIFSSDPKGVVNTCSEHSWADDEELFACDACKKVFIDHYTWERYQTEVNGQTLCLKCAAEQYFAAPAHWIEPSAVTKVVLQSRRPGPLFNRETGILNIARCRHVLGVQQPLPAGIEFFENAEFDGGNGHQISGENLVDVIKRLDQPFCPVMDAAYQFSVSIGLYVRRAEVVSLPQAA